MALEREKVGEVHLNVVESNCHGLYCLDFRILRRNLRGKSCTLGRIEPHSLLGVFQADTLTKGMISMLAIQIRSGKLLLLLLLNLKSIGLDQMLIQWA